MKIISVPTLSSRKKNIPLLLIPCFQKGKGIEVPSALKSHTGLYHLPLERGDFKGKEGEVCLHYPDPASHVERVCLIGLGDGAHLTTEKLRRAFSLGLKQALRLKMSQLTLAYPEAPSLHEDQTMRGIFEGVFLSSYAFTHKSKEEAPRLLETLELLGFPKKSAAAAEKAQIIADSVNLARDLVNGNADDVHPSHLANIAVELGKLPHVKTTVHDKKWLEKEGLGLVVAVSRGAAHLPRFIISTYTGNPRSKDNTLLIGKGVTYDTGGLNLKPTGSMETMRCDMAGAAALLGVLQAASKLKLKQNITVIIPAVENAIGSLSYKPGDVYKSYSGKTVEIINTDAEGRLILADALSYGIRHFKPTRVIDIATLTGACEVALGSEVSGLFTTHDALADLLMRSGMETYERVWKLPLVEEYKELLKTEFADIKNHGGRAGGAIVAAIFLQAFVGDLPWAHLDIAATAYYGEAKRYHPKMATGIGVRLLIEFLEQLG